MSKPFYIIGFMGTGKSSLKSFLEKRGEVVDLDAVIESEIQMDIATYFERFGERAFRDLETEVLQTIVADFILTGGGIVEDETNLEWMRRHGELVALDLPFEDCWERIKDSNRPLVQRGRGAVESLYLRRHSLYTRADHVVDASDSPERITEKIIQLKEENHGLD